MCALPPPGDDSERSGERTERRGGRGPSDGLSDLLPEVPTRRPQQPKRGGGQEQPWQTASGRGPVQAACQIGRSVQKRGPGQRTERLGDKQVTTFLLLFFTQASMRQGVCAMCLQTGPDVDGVNDGLNGYRFASAPPAGPPQRTGLMSCATKSRTRLTSGALAQRGLGRARTSSSPR